MVNFSAKFFVVAALAVIGFAIPAKRTIAQVEADVARISRDVHTLYSDINAFPSSGGTATEALAIHTDSTNLNSAITQGTTDVKDTGKFPESDAETIWSSLHTIEPTIIGCLNAIITKKSGFEHIPVGGIVAVVKEDLTTLNASTTALENALIAAMPADLKANATAMKTSINAAFQRAITAYAN